MPALAHIGVGFASKKIASEVPVIYLILAAEFIEIIFIILWVSGIEYPPKQNTPSFSPYSHSLFMGLFWSLFTGLITFLFSRNKRLGLIIGLLVFSHTVLDFIASPKTAFYPEDTGMPFFLNTSVTYGLGLWRNKTIGLIGEYGILLAGIVIYIITLKKLKHNNRSGNSIIANKNQIK